MIMSNEVKWRIAIAFQLVGVIGGIGGIGGLVGAWYVIPYRLTGLEERVRTMEFSRGKDYELLLRIDERLKTVQQYIEKHP